MASVYSCGVEQTVNTDGSDSSEQTVQDFQFQSRGNGTPVPTKRTFKRQGGPNHKKQKSDWDLTHYLPLYKAALQGDWKEANEIFIKDRQSMTAKITHVGETALHIAVGAGDANEFVKELVNLLLKSNIALNLTDRFRNTALHFAAVVGNTEAAKILVEKDPTLLQQPNSDKDLPFHRAAQYGHKETVRYLLSVTQHRYRSQCMGRSGVRLLNLLITAEFYGIALDLLKGNPSLALEREPDKLADEQDHGKSAYDQDRHGKTALETLAQKPHAFASGSQLKWWQRLVLNCIPVAKDNITPEPIKGRDEENPTESSENCQNESTQSGFLTRSTPYMGFCAVHLIHHNTHRNLVSTLAIKHIHHTELMHQHTLELVRRLCQAAISKGGEKAKSLLQRPILTAAKLGIQEIVIEIVKIYPYSVWFQGNDGYNIFQLAVKHRQENIFNLIYQMSSYKHFATARVDKSGNNILHLAGILQPSKRVSGAAVQMQRDLQWFEEVKNVVQPSFKEKRNKYGNTPSEMFTKNHKKLVQQGEKWMKDTASYCTVVATLVATVVFAVAFTVPGGNNNEEGIPIFLHDLSFMIFVVSDAMALFSSSTSVLMFLGILTSRYSENDFKSLPKRLIIGLIALFFSIATMVIAFSASLYIVLFHRLKWVHIPIAVLACIPVTLFGFLQFPLLIEICQSTFGPSIFRKQNKETIH